MLKQAFSIRFSVSDDPYAVNYHDVQNLGEDLMRRLEAERLGTVDNWSVADAEIFVSLSSPRHRGRARRLIERTLTNHAMHDISVITEE